MDDVRLSKYLHLPWMLVIFEAQEWAIIFAFYFLAVMGQGWWYLGVVIGPAIMIPLSRKVPRGASTQYGSMVGAYKFTHYPPLYVREFHE